MHAITAVITPDVTSISIKDYSRGHHYLHTVITVDYRQCGFYDLT